MIKVRITYLINYLTDLQSSLDKSSFAGLKKRRVSPLDELYDDELSRERCIQLNFNLSRKLRENSRENFRKLCISRCKTCTTLPTAAASSGLVKSSCGSTIQATPTHPLPSPGFSRIGSGIQEILRKRLKAWNGHSWRDFLRWQGGRNYLQGSLDSRQRPLDLVFVFEIEEHLLWPQFTLVWTIGNTVCAK